MILAVLQARTSSSRLPGKVMLPLAGAPMLERQVERLLRARTVDQLVIATSERPEDDCVMDLAESAGVGGFRGALDDVLDRFYRAAEPHRPEYVVRLTGDCPLADWNVIDLAVSMAVGEAYDYVSNGLKPTWPDGLDVEVFTFAALEAAWREGTGPVEREHVTPFIHRRPERFRLGSLEQSPDLSHMRWTVDEPADYAFVSNVYDLLYENKPDFGTADILRLLDSRPELSSLNANIDRNEGLRKSEAAEALVKGKS